MMLVSNADEAPQVPSPFAQYVRGRKLVEKAPEIIGIPKEELFSQSRAQHYCFPRNVLMLVLREHGLRFKQVALLVCRDDHSTAINAVAKAKKLVARYPDLAELKAKLEAEL